MSLFKKQDQTPTVNRELKAVRADTLAKYDALAKMMGSADGEPADDEYVLSAIIELATTENKLKGDERANAYKEVQAFLDKHTPDLLLKIIGNNGARSTRRRANASDGEELTKPAYISQVPKSAVGGVR